MLAAMKNFDSFVNAGMIATLAEIGEAASIGGNQFVAAFSEATMDMTAHVYGDSDEVTIEATCIKSALTNEPRINETLIRVNQRKTYVITTVDSDVGSYTLRLREKNG